MRAVGPRWKQRVYTKLPTDLIEEIQQYQRWRGMSDRTFPEMVAGLLNIALVQIAKGYGGRPWRYPEPEDERK
jgi:hypothetical protein